MFIYLSMVSVMYHCSLTFVVDFREFLLKRYNDEKEIIDFIIDLLRKFQLRNMFLII